MTTFSTLNATKAVVSLILVAAAVIATIQGMSTMNAPVGTIWMGWDEKFKIFSLICIQPIAAPFENLASSRFELNRLCFVKMNIPLTLGIFLFYRASSVLFQRRLLQMAKVFAVD
jgi:hypothetical protein